MCCSVTTKCNSWDIYMLFLYNIIRQPYIVAQSIDHTLSRVINTQCNALALRGLRSVLRREWSWFMPPCYLSVFIRWQVNQYEMHSNSKHPTPFTLCSFIHNAALCLRTYLLNWIGPMFEWMGGPWGLLVGGGGGKTSRVGIVRKAPCIAAIIFYNFGGNL